jgi:hypothetical protein
MVVPAVDSDAFLQICSHVSARHSPHNSHMTLNAHSPTVIQPAQAQLIDAVPRDVHNTCKPAMYSKFCLDCNSALRRAS